MTCGFQLDDAFGILVPSFVVSARRGTILWFRDDEVPAISSSVAYSSKIVDYANFCDDPKQNITLHTIAEGSPPELFLLHSFLFRCQELCSPVWIKHRLSRIQWIIEFGTLVVIFGVESTKARILRTEACKQRELVPTRQLAPLAPFLWSICDDSRASWKRVTQIECRKQWQLERWFLYATDRRCLVAVGIPSLEIPNKQKRRRELVPGVPSHGIVLARNSQRLWKWYGGGQSYNLYSYDISKFVVNG